LRSQGKSLRSIARTLDIPVSRVRRTLGHNAALGSISSVIDEGQRQG
jgi:hypothetical protein